MRLKYRTDNDGLFIMKKNDYEVSTENMLREYLPDTLKEPQPTDIVKIAEKHLDLKLKHEIIKLNGEVLGLIAFSNGKYYVQNENGEWTALQLEEGTVLIDASLTLPEKHNCKMFTIAHETAHWICHREYFSTSKQLYCLRTSCYDAYSCGGRLTGFTKTKQLNVALKIESQADLFAIALMMPKDTFTGHMIETLRSFGVSSDYLVYNKDVTLQNQIISVMAQKFEVSCFIAEVRMQMLGLLQKQR